MKQLIQVIALSIFLIASQAANAALNVFACEPEWGALAQELCGEHLVGHWSH